MIQKIKIHFWRSTPSILWKNRGPLCLLPLQNNQGRSAVGADSSGTSGQAETAKHFGLIQRSPHRKAEPAEWSPCLFFSRKTANLLLKKRESFLKKHLHSLDKIIFQHNEDCFKSSSLFVYFHISVLFCPSTKAGVSISSSL